MKEVQVLGVVGCGLMGTGIVEVAALAGFDVVAVKATPGTVDGVVRRVLQSMDRAAAKGKFDAATKDAAVARITFTSKLDLLAQCDLAIESTAEALASKKRVLLEMECSMRTDAVLATNTSSLPLAQLKTVLVRPSMFLGAHFFSPVPMMKLVELAPTGETRPEVTEIARRTVERLGKTPIILSDEPGYIVNRLLVPFLCHAAELLEQGIAGAHEIDAAMKLGCAHPLGPLALSDLIGLDVVLAMAQSLSGELRDKRFRAPSLLRRLVLAGQLGKKAGVGFYDYRGKEPVQNLEVGRALRTPQAARAS